MSQALECSCGKQVLFEEYDRGFEVYCLSCGKGIQVPTLDVPPTNDEPEPKEAVDSAVDADASAGELSERRNGADGEQSASIPPRGVFASGESLARSPIIGEVFCLCQTRIPYRLDDVGGAVYCPSCGSEVLVGAELGQRSAAAARPETPADSDRAVAVARVRFLRSPAGILTAAVLAGVVWYGANIPWGDNASLAEAIGLVKPRPQKTTKTGEFDPDAVTLEAIDELADNEDPWQALMLAHGWGRGLHDSGKPDDDPRFDRLKVVARRILDDRAKQMLETIKELLTVEQVAEKLDPWRRVLTAYAVPEGDDRVVALERLRRKWIEETEPITMEMIRGLLEAENTGEALQQAHEWQDALRQRGAGDTEERVVLLRQTVRDLREKLLQPAIDPPWIADFRRTVDTLRDCLFAKDLDGAIAARDAAEHLLSEHADDLSSMTQRYFTLKEHLRQLEFSRKGVETIEQCLASAEQATNAGADERVTEAIEFKEQANFLARGCPMTPEQGERLKERMGKLAEPLRLAKGRRSVDDAKRANAANDMQARAKAVQSAHALLEGLPVSTVRPLLEEIKQWDEEPAPGKRPPRGGATSAVGRQLELRTLYERALAAYGEDKPEDVRTAGLQISEMLQFGPDADPNRMARVGDRFFDCIERQIGRLGIQSQEQSEAQLVENLAEVLELLDKARPWKQSDRWKALEGAARGHGARRGQQELARAQELASQDQLQAAVAAAELAIRLGDGDTVRLARGLLDTWRKEIQLRSDVRAEDAAWKAIQKMSAANSESLAIWERLQTYLKQFPAGAHSEEVRKLFQAAQDELTREFAKRVTTLNETIGKQRWRQAVRELRLLESIATTDVMRADLKSAVARIEQAHKDAIASLAGLDRLTKFMASPNDILKVRYAALRVLAFEPDHGDARLMLEASRAKAAPLAKSRVERAARMAKFDKAHAREQLESAIALDPESEHGKRAAQMLKDLAE